MVAFASHLLLALAAAVASVAASPVEPRYAQLLSPFLHILDQKADLPFALSRAQPYIDWRTFKAHGVNLGSWIESEVSLRTNAASI